MTCRAALFLGLTLSLAPGLVAQEDAPAPPQEEFRALRQLIEAQSKQIEALTQQVAQLNQRFDSPPKATPAEAAAPAPGIVEPPKALPGSEGPKHQVAKGETLTSIAKRYNIPITDLQKANEIKDDRKLQIGQVLSIPAPSGKPAEPSSEKKENP